MHYDIQVYKPCQFSSRFENWFIRKFYSFLFSIQLWRLELRGIYGSLILYKMPTRGRKINFSLLTIKISESPCLLFITWDTLSFNEHSAEHPALILNIGTPCLWLNSWDSMPFPIPWHTLYIIEYLGTP